jgi:hypothetical protein
VVLVEEELLLLLEVFVLVEILIEPLVVELVLLVVVLVVVDVVVTLEVMSMQYPPETSFLITELVKLKVMISVDNRLAPNLRVTSRFTTDATTLLLRFMDEMVTTSSMRVWFSYCSI